MTGAEAIKILRRELEPDDGVWYPFGEVEEALDMAIEALELDIVRCKDCKYWLQHEQFGFDEDNEEYNDYCALLVPDDDYYAYARKADDYCSYGERREDGEE